MRAGVMMLSEAAVTALALVGQVFRIHLALAAKLRALPRLNLRLLGRLCSNQARFTGLQAVPLIAAGAIVVGGVSGVQTINLLTGLAPELIGGVLVGIIVREVGPLIAAAVLIGRSGTAIAAELGSMRLNGELDALKAMRIDAVDYVVLPRVLGMLSAMFFMVVAFDVLGVLGGLGAASLIQDVPFGALLSRVFGAMTNADLAVTALKALSFGQAVAVLSCHFGLKVRHSPTELPQAVTKAVVACMISVMALDAVITASFYLL